MGGVAVRKISIVFPSPSPTKPPLPPLHSIFMQAVGKGHTSPPSTQSLPLSVCSRVPAGRDNGFRSAVECCFGSAYSVSFYLKRLSFVINTFLTLSPLEMSLSTLSSSSLNGTW